MKWIMLHEGHKAIRADRFVKAQILRVTDQRWVLQAETIDGEGLMVRDNLTLEEARMELANFVDVAESGDA